MPILCKKCFKDTHNTPNPYIELRLKFILDASAKYLVGHVTSPIENPAYTICDNI
jgi:hypothetical protein